MSPLVALVGATGLHAGFQLVVSVLVYPALLAHPDFAAAHDRHSRSIVPLVAVVYAACAAACVWVLVAGPRPAGVWVACAATALAAGVTASVAAPTHAALAVSGPTYGLRVRLARADLLRTVAAVTALVASLLAG